MDKLQWFKFSYAEWRMGKIQRCSEITQARFINLCCLYWSKEGILTKEDAEIEIDKEHLDFLISKKIVTIDTDFICIDFLNEQLKEIEEDVNKRSKSGIIGNLKRWHKDIYKKYEKSEITLNEAISLSKLSHTDSTPIATPSQNIAEKRREEKRREENINISFDDLKDFFIKTTGKKITVVSEKTKKEINKRLKEGYTLEHIKKAITNCYNDEYHKQTKHKYLTLEFISRADKLERFSTMNTNNTDLTDLYNQLNK